MTPLWSIIRTELAREKAVARRIAAKGYKVAELIEIRLTRASRYAKRRHIAEIQVLPGKVLALVPDIAFDEIGDLPHVTGIARNGQGQPWRIPEPQVAEFAENLSALNSGEWAGLIAEAERDNQARRKKGRRWLKLADWKPQT